MRLIINRYKKIPGFTDEDIEKATTCKLLWKLPNNFQSVSPAIDKGAPVALLSHDDISRSYRGLAETLADASASSEGSMDLSYNPDKAGTKKKAVGHLLISPLAGRGSSWQSDTLGGAGLLRPASRQSLTTGLQPLSYVSEE